MTVLESIGGPEDLKGLSQEQLAILAGEIRDTLIETVIRTSGHLGPNLGVVELTIALHRVFSSPRDRIVFDTGHQAYVHKLLTGRQARVRHAAPARRHVRVPEPGRVRARHRGELARLDQPVLRRRAGQGVQAARRDGPGGRRGHRRRRADRRDGLGGAEQHLRGRGLPPGRRGQRQRPVLPADDRRPGQQPGLGPHQPAVRERPRLHQDHAVPDARRRAAGVRDAARHQEGPQGRPAAAGAVRGPRPEVPGPDRRPRRGHGRAGAAPRQGLRRPGAGAPDHPEGLRLRPGRRERGRLPAPGARHPPGRRPCPARSPRPGPRSSATNW